LDEILTKGPGRKPWAFLYLIEERTADGWVWGIQEEMKA
jgi:hypothetical protein